MTIQLLALIVVVVLVIVPLAVVVVRQQKQGDKFKPAEPETTVWLVGDKFVERWYNPNDGTVIFSVNGTIAQKWTGDSPDPAEVKAVLELRGVDTKLPWILQETRQLELERLLIKAAVSSMPRDVLEKYLARKLIDPANG